MQKYPRAAWETLYATICVYFNRMWYGSSAMETITIDFDISDLEISTSNRRELVRIIDDALQDSGCGRWTCCLYTKDTITIYAVVEDEEQARSLIRSAIKGHPVFYHWYESIFVKNDNMT